MTSGEIERLRAENASLRSELESCRELTSRVISAEDQGRRRIAQLIHDDALQSLLAAHQELLEAAPGRAQVTRAHEVVGEAIERLREALLSLHPVTLEQGGLEQALGAVARQAERQGELEVAVSCEAAALDHADELLLAAARELLTNAARHSGAATVTVALRRLDGAVELEVTDDGRGLDPQSRERALAAGHIGLASLAQRVSSAAGTLELSDARSGSRRGTRAVVRIPDDARG